MGIQDKKRTNILTVSCITLLQSLGWMSWRQNNHATPNRDKDTGKIIGMRKMPPGSRKGVPDILAVPNKSGVLHGFEIKVGKDKQSEDQIQFMNDLQNRGGQYIVITEIDDLIEYLERYVPGM